MNEREQSPPPDELNPPASSGDVPPATAEDVPPPSSPQDPTPAPSEDVPPTPAEGGPPVSGPPPGSPAQPSTGARRWRTWQLAVASLVALIIGVGIGAAINNEGNESSGQTGTPEPRDRARDGSDEDAAPRTTLPRTTTTTAPSADEGSRENPYPLGTPLSSDDGWELTVNGVNFDAAGEIAAENQFNDPAPPGFRYALINVTYTNSGDEPDDPSFAVSIEMVGSQNRLWGVSNASCTAVIPEPVSRAGELFSGGSFTGNSCLVVPEEEVADGSLLVAVSGFFGGDPVFVRTS